MNTHKIMASLMMVFLTISLIAPMVLAEENVVIATVSDNLEEEAGINPDSVFYGLDRAMERIQLALTFDKAKKSETALRNAEERLAEVKAMIQEGKQYKSEVAGNYHKESMDRVKKAMEGIESNGDQVKAKAAYEATERIQLKLEAHKAKAIAVKAGILERQSNKMSEEQIAHMEQVFSRIQKRTEVAKTSALQREDSIRTRYKVLSGKTDEEVSESLGEQVQTQTKASEETTEETQSGQVDQSDQASQAKNQ